MDEKQLGQLIKYIVYQVEDQGGYVTTIRLVKFLYLIDLEHYRRLGKTLTGLDWICYHFGPYAFELPQVGRRLGFDLEREEFATVKGKRGYLIRVHEAQELPYGLNFSSEAIINRILEIWADRETDELLEYVYFHTEPMKQTRRGERLDFRLVERGTGYYGLHFPMKEATVRKLRESIKSYREDDESEYVTPSSNYDEVYTKGMQTLDDEPEPANFSGLISIIDNMQHQIKPEIEE